MRELIKGTQKRQKGFTLVEVIVVTIIIAILSAIAVPSVLSRLPNMRLKAASRDLYSHMMRAKTEAIKSNTSTAFTFTSGTGNPCTGGGYIFTNSAGTIVNATMQNDVCLSTTSTFPNGFLANGTASGVIGSVRLTHPKTSKTYTMTQTIAGGISIK